MLIYTHLPIEKLYYGVSRDLREERFQQMMRRLRESIEREGLKNPLSCGNVKDDGTYQVNRGNTCLATLIDMGMKEAACIVCCKPDQKNNPTGRLVTEDELVELHKSGVSKVYEVNAPQCFAVAPADVKLFSIGV